MEAQHAAKRRAVVARAPGTCRTPRPSRRALVMMATLKPGDIVVVNKLDRLGRSTRELLDLIDRIGKAGASFRSLGDPLWDTSSASRNRRCRNAFPLPASAEKE